MANEERHWDTNLKSSEPRYGTDAKTLGIDRPKHIELLNLWNTIRGDRRAPTREEFDPSDVRTLLGSIFLVERLDDGDYFYRVVGTTIVSHVGFESSRKRLSELESFVDTNRIRQHFDDVVSRNMPRYDFASGPWRGREWQYYHRLLLPLSTDGDTVTHILGLVDIETMSAPDSGSG